MRRHHSAFTLLEVLLAIGIVIFAVSIVANLQSRSLNRLLRDGDRLEKVFLIKKHLFKRLFSFSEKKKKTVEQLESPEMTVTTALEDVAKKSSLAVLKDKIDIVRSIGEWKLSNQRCSMTLISFALKPQKDKQEEKK